MPYVPGRGRISDVYRSNNVYANNVLVATWQPPGGTEAFFAAQGLSIDQIVIDTPENQYVADSVDADNIDFSDTSPSSQITRSTTNVTNGVSSGVLTANTVPADSSTTIVSLLDSAAAGAPSTGVVTTGTFAAYSDAEYPKTSSIYDVVQLTASTSLATFTKSTPLWNSGDPKWLKAQNGLTVPEILDNLSNLAFNTYEPILAKYPNVIVTNTFRQGTGSSQHQRGQAMDIQFKGISQADYFEIAKWIRDNVPFDQLLLEKSGTTVWIHLSFWSGTGIRVATNSANRVGTMLIKSASSVTFTPGLQQVA